MATTSSPAATTNAVAKGTVVFVQGEAYLRDISGKLTAIKPGDVVAEGQEIVTQAGAVVELQLGNGAKLSVGPERTLLLNDELFATAAPEHSENVIASSLGAEADRVIQALNSGADPFDNLEDPAAGLAGGGVGDQTHDFIRLARILEDVTPVSYTYTSSGSGVDFLPAGPQGNVAPVAADDAITIDEDQPAVVDVLANDRDPNGDPLTVIAAEAANGVVTINPDGTLSYVPKADFNGVDTVTYTISDGKGGTANATVTIQVTPVNDAPIANPDAGTTPEDTPITIPVLNNDSDIEGDPLTVISATVDPGKGSVSINPDGTLTYTPAPNYNGPTEITYTVSDGHGGTTTTTVSVEVTPVNDAPVANPDNATTPEDTPITVAVLGNDVDPDGDPLTVTGATVDPRLGTVTVNPDGSLTFIPTPNYNGPVTIVYTVTDGHGETASSTLTINVTPVNDPPVANPDATSTQQGTPVSIAVLPNDSDVDGDPLTVIAASVNNPSNGAVSINPDGSLTFTPAPSFSGQAQVTYTISDGHGGTASTTVTIDVSPTTLPPGGHAPVANDDVVTVAHDQPKSGSVAGNDTPSADGGNVWALGSGPANGTVTLDANGNYTYTPNAGYTGTDSFTYTVTDANGDHSTATVQVTVQPPANLGVPIANDDVVTVAHDQPKSGSVAGNDTPSADGGNVWALGSGPANGT
ncbi:retention module-containing protein, partial [Zoogloea sp.]|uniref:retention module-containing protein n=1 Tax=Zoogloea sp. TaxID=49181 RepID=UPI001415F341